MIKYKSEYISEYDIKIETDRYFENEGEINEERFEVVKLTQISTGLEITFCSTKGQLHAYNRALKLLEEKYINALN